MTRALEIATPFADFSELSENFAQRVDQERLMLPFAEPIGEGEWVTFTVLFADGSTALAGTGKCQGSYDNGEEHPPEYRYDVVVESLTLEGTAEVMFERLLMARSSMMGEGNADPATGEVSIEDLEAQHAAKQAAEPPAAEADALESVEADVADDVPDDGGFSEPAATAVGNLDELVAATARSAPPPSPPKAPAAAPRGPAPAPKARPGVPTAPAALPSPHSFGDQILLRPTLPAAWSPEPEARPDAATSSGLFDYGRGGLPKPARPPRPEISPEARVAPAPGPGRPARRLPPSGTETSQYEVSDEEASA